MANSGYFDRSIFTANDQNNGDTSDITKLENIHTGLADQSDANWAYVQSLVTSGTLTPLPPDFLFRQAIINGNFDIWQRGTSVVSPNGAFTADRFFINGTDNNAKASQSSVVPNSKSRYSLRLEAYNAVSGVGAYSEARQFIEDYALFAGQQFVLSGMVKCDSGASFNPILYDGVNTFFGSTHASTSWEPFELKGMISSAPTFLTPALRFNRANLAVGIGINLSQLQLCVGDVALPFQPKTIEEELRKSLRHTLVPQTNSMFVRMAFYTANTMVFNVPVPVPMRIDPTIRGAVNTDIVVRNMAGVAQTGFTASAVTNGDTITVTMTKTTHGLTDATLEIKTTSGFDAEF